MLGPQLRELLRWPRPLPLEDERVRLLHEVKQIISNAAFNHSNIHLFLVSLFLLCFQFCELSSGNKHVLKFDGPICTVRFFC